MRQVWKKIVALVLLCALTAGCIPLTSAEAASIAAKSYGMAVGETLKVAPLIQKKNKNAVYSYRSSKKGVAAVNKKGIVTAKAAGTVKITVSETKNKKTKKVGTVAITVHEAESRYMDGEYYFTAQTGFFEKYPAQLDIDEFLRYRNPKATYTWQSGDPELLTVSEEGLVTHAGLLAGQSYSDVALFIRETYKGKTRTITLVVGVVAPKMDTYSWSEWSPEEGMLYLSLKVGDSFCPRNVLFATVGYTSTWDVVRYTEAELLDSLREYYESLKDSGDGAGASGDDSEKALYPVKDENGDWTGEYMAQKPGVYYVYLVAYNYLTEIPDDYLGSIEVVVTE